MAYFTPAELRSYGMGAVSVGPTIKATAVTRKGKTVTVEVKRPQAKQAAPMQVKAVKDGPLAQRVEPAKKKLAKGLKGWDSPRRLQGLVVMPKAGTGGIGGLAGLSGSASRALYMSAWNDAKRIVADGIARTQPLLDKLDGALLGVQDQLAALESLPVMQDAGSIQSQQALRTVKAAAQDFQDKLDGLRTSIDDVNAKSAMVEEAEGGGNIGANSPAQQALHAAKLAVQGFDALTKSLQGLINRLRSTADSATLTINRENQALMDRAAAAEAERQAQEQARILSEQQAAAEKAAQEQAVQLANQQAEADRQRREAEAKAAADAQAAQAQAAAQAQQQLELQRMQFEQEKQRMELQARLAEAQAQQQRSQFTAPPGAYGPADPYAGYQAAPQATMPSGAPSQVIPVPGLPIPGAVPTGFAPPPPQASNVYNTPATYSPAFGPAWTNLPGQPSFEQESVVAISSPMTPPTAYADPYAGQNYDGGSGYGPPPRPTTDYAPEMFGMGSMGASAPIDQARVQAYLKDMNARVAKLAADRQATDAAQAQAEAAAAEAAAKSRAESAQTSKNLVMGALVLGAGIVGVKVARNYFKKR